MIKKILSVIAFLAIVIALWYTLLRPLNISPECVELCKNAGMIASYETDVCYCKSR